MASILGLACLLFAGFTWWYLGPSTDFARLRQAQREAFASAKHYYLYLSGLAALELAVIFVVIAVSS